MSEPRKIGDTVVSFTSRRGAYVFRRVEKRGDATYITPRFQMRVQRGKRRVFFQLPSTVKEAGTVADAIDAFLDFRSNTLDMAIKEFDPERWEMLNPAMVGSTVADVIKAHEAAEKALGLSSKAAKSYRDSLVIVFRQGIAHRRRGGKEPTDEDVLALPMSEYTLRLVSDFKLARVAKAGDNKAEQEKKKRSANGVLRSVASLFSQQARRYYTDLVLPDGLDEVLADAKFRKVGKIRKRLPATEVLTRIFTDAGELRKADQNAYVSFLLAAHAGFRKGEIATARPDWLQPGNPPRAWVHATEDALSKSKDERFAEIQPWVFGELAMLTKDRPYMLTGTMTERTDHVFERLNEWVKARGFNDAKGEKGVHGLRFLFGAYIANRRSLYTAQKFLGHESQSTTEKHYTDIMLDESVFELWETAPAWVGSPLPVPVSAPVPPQAGA